MRNYGANMLERYSQQGGARYYVTFIDDHSRYMVVKLIKNKSDVMQHFMEYKAWAENVTGCRILVLRSDNGGEYCSNAFDQYLAEHGISRQLTPPYTPEHNGVAERANRTIMETARSMLQAAGLDNRYWGEAVMTAVYLRNRSPSRVLGLQLYKGKKIPKVLRKTPYELWNGQKPSIGHLKVFGCRAYAHIPDERRSKLAAKAVACIFVGYSLESKAYRLYDPITRRTIVSRDVKFWEDHKYSSETSVVEIIGGGGAEQLNNHNMPPSVPDQSPPVYPSNSPPPRPQTEVIEEKKGQWNMDVDGDSSSEGGVRRSARSRQPPRDWWDVSTHIPERRWDVKDNQDSALVAMHELDSDMEPLYALSADVGVDEPINYSDAMKRSDAKQWEKAAQDEYNSIQAAGTWSLVALPAGRKAIGCKWIFKIKYKANGSIERHKGRLVAKGYSQKEGLDFNETFAPVAKFASIRSLLALAASYDLEIHQMDVKTAFLNGDLEEEIYMVQPEGFVVKGKEDLVCKLNKSLYGLKQASRAWYQKMDQAMLSAGFLRLQADTCVYVLRRDGLVIFVALYVDDLLLLSNSLSELISLKQELAKKFEMKDLGEAQFILGIQIERDRSAHTLSQSQQSYIKKIVERYSMSNSKAVSTPLDLGTRLSKSDSASTPEEVAEMKNVPYQSAVGAIMYAMLGTRPDIAFAVTTLSQFNNNPGMPHWVGVKRVLRYLNASMNNKLVYGGSNGSIMAPKLIGYCDADWASNIDDRRSVTGYVFMLAGGAVSWKTKKQPTVALSSVEAEYMAATQATKEATWFRAFFSQLGVSRIVTGPSVIFSDSQGSIALGKNPEYHQRTKHIDVQHHFVREHVNMGTVEFKFISTDLMVADILTKPLGKTKHQQMVESMGIKSTMSGSVESH
jgi:hypothetical protein